MCRIAKLVVLLAASLTALAQSSPIWEPPNLRIPDALPRATASKELITTLRVAGIRIDLETTALRRVQEELGGEMGDSGDAGESLEWLCLHGSDANGKWALWLESDVELYRGDINKFAVQRIDRNAKMDPRCRSIVGDIELPGGLRLGLTETQVRKILGKPTARYGSTLLFDHEHEESLHNETVTVENTVCVTLRRGVVSSIEVWKISVL